MGGIVQGCRGTITLSGPAGEGFGSAHFDVATDAVDAPVWVPLTPAAVAALRDGTVVQVDLVPDGPPDFQTPGGYRILMRSG